MSSAVPKSQEDKYKSRIQDLERENGQLRASKLQLIMSTANEIERLRQYIYSLTLLMEQKRPLNNKNAEMEEKEEKSTIITPRAPMVAVCEHCGSTTKVENNYFITVSSTGGPGPGGVDDIIVNDSSDDHDEYGYHEAAEASESDYNEEDDAKQGSLSSDDDHDVVNNYSSDDIHDIDVIHDNENNNNYITPGRVSVIYNNDSFVGHTRGLTAKDLPSFDHNQSMGEHASIPLPDNFMDDSFVICDFCTSNLPLQFVRKYPDTMQCSKCCAFFEFIFLCNECGKCVCSECYEYEAKMQSIDRITNNFNTNKYMDDGKLDVFQQRVNDESASMLNKLFAESASMLQINEFSLKLCYLICFFLDDLDLCEMLPDASFSAQLFDIYWTLSPRKISFQKKIGFSDIRLFHSLKWANTNKNNNINNVWSIKQVIDDDIMIENYLSKNYQQITFDLFVTKLTKHMNETNPQYSMLLDVLKLVTAKNNVKSCEQLDYNQYAWRELGGSPIICSKGMYFVWNIPILQRSYCFNVDNRIFDAPFGK